MKYKGIKRKTLKRKKKTLKRKKKTLKRKILHLCTIKSPTSPAFIGSKSNSYHALEKCEGVKKKGGSHIYDMDSGEYQTVNDGQDFFRKILSTEQNNEEDIVTFLQNFPEYKEHNIVSIYAVTPQYIDMEELVTQYTDPDYAQKYIDDKQERAKQITAMREAKDFLQSIGIMYMDWKFDNIGRSKDTDTDTAINKYKLFDFDASGIANLETNKWIIKPLYFTSYGKNKQLPPKELDDLLFERELVNAQPLVTYTTF
jgi:hypothetical protein